MSNKENINNQEHEPVIEVEGMGVMEEPALQPPVQMQPKKRTAQDVLAEDVNFLRGLHFSLDEVEKFGLIIAKVKQDLVNLIIDLDKEAQDGKTDA